MILAQTAPSPICCPMQDRSLGEAGAVLRALMEADEQQQQEPDRGAAILACLTAALHRANTEQNILLSPDAFTTALDLLRILPRDIPLPEVVVESENEIGLDWDLGTRQVLSLTVRDTPMVGYAALIGQEPMHGRTRFAGEIPRTLRFVFSQFFGAAAR